MKNIYIYKYKMQRKYFKETSDHLIYYYLYEPICIQIAPFLYNFGVTPNMITVFRFICGIIAAYFFYLLFNISDKRIAGILTGGVIILLFINGVCDDLDGYMARKYKQTSKIGEVLDVIVDFNLAILFIYIIVSKTSAKYRARLICYGAIYVAIGFSIRKLGMEKGKPLLSLVVPNLFLTGSIFTLALLYLNLTKRAK